MTLMLAPILGVELGQFADLAQVLVSVATPRQRLRSTMRRSEQLRATAVAVRIHACLHREQSQKLGALGNSAREDFT
jgi:hypothetical protein